MNVQILVFTSFIKWRYVPAALGNRLRTSAASELVCHSCVLHITYLVFQYDCKYPNLSDIFYCFDPKAFSGFHFLGENGDGSLMIDADHASMIK